MSTSSEGFLGRQLLSIRNTIGSVTDPSRLRKLRRREIRILLELGNPAAAGDLCRELVSDNPSWPPGYSMLADLACRSGKWEEGERLFERAAVEHEAAGNTKAAVRLRTGPVYRLAEAREDYEKCLSLSSGDRELESILKVRSERLSGNNDLSLPDGLQDLLAQHLLMLESAWRGTQQRELLQTALEWSNTEAEWRWRFIVEGMAVWNPCHGQMHVRLLKQPVRRLQEVSPPEPI